jgi:hypothetical protein
VGLIWNYTESGVLCASVLVKCFARVFSWSTLRECSREVLLCECSSEVLLCECSSEVLCASVLVESGLGNRDYGRRESAALTMRQPSIRKSW